MSVTVNVFATNQPQNTFLQQTQGLMQGVAHDDPPSHMWLAGGTLGAGESVPMWGGRAISEFVNYAGSGSDGLGPTIYSGALATGEADTGKEITGFSVYNQAGSMVIGPGLTAPVAAVGNYVAFYRFGSNARIPVQIDPATVAAIIATPGPITQQLYWDPVNYRITDTSTSNLALPAACKLLSINTNSKLVTYAGGLATWTAGTLALLQV